MKIRVEFEHEDQMARVVLAAPKANIIDQAMMAELESAFDGLSGRGDLKAIVLTGEGPNFSFGASVQEHLPEHISETLSRLHALLRRIAEAPAPTIAAVRGQCLGGGLELALSCTFRIASTKAKIGFPELGLGIIPAFGGTGRLVRTVGYAKALELILFRSIVNGDEAYRIGLVNRVAEQEELMDKAKEMAQNLASLSPVAVKLEMELVLNTTDQGFDAGLALESSLASLAVASPEAKELLGSFLKGKK